ncbi:sigma 54 modulation/S30EA ribosomal C-terminal domain-containing protein [Bacillus velezensis]|uniref:sigma 54 modulation/S30EA ribosomal C-terminal domain-containing protein n=1 Tax=Bacillus velezensis TaxID=492670 RepID=UPI0011A04B2A
MRKHKTKLNPKFPHQPLPKHYFHNPTPPHTPLPLHHQIQHHTPQILPQNPFNLKPIHNQQPILQMNILPHNFFLFTNPHTNLTNLLYPTNHPKYPLIQPTQ